MANYGTIPTGTGIKLEYISDAHERVKEGLGTLRPWSQMIDIHSFGFPRSFTETTARVTRNLAYFRMNYAMILLLILFLSLLWHPISLIVFIIMMAVWLFLYFLRDEPVMIFGRLISDRVVLILLLVLTIGVLLFTHATLNIIVSLLIGILVVLIQAAVRRTDDLPVEV